MGPGRGPRVQPGPLHDGAAVAAQRALEAQGRVHVLAARAADALEQLAEEQQDVPVVLGRALHVAALPRLAHQVGHVPARDHAAALQVPLVAHDDDGRLRGADHPAERREGRSGCRNTASSRHPWTGRRASASGAALQPRTQTLSSLTDTTGAKVHTTVALALEEVESGAG